MASEWCTEQGGPVRLQQVPPVIAAECNEFRHMKCFPADRGNERDGQRT